MSYLQIVDLTIHYATGEGMVQALNNISLSMEKGEALGLVGESGSGKSTLGLAILRSLPSNAQPIGGAIKLEDRDLLSISMAEFRGTYSWKIISMAFQGALNSLNPVIKVGHQIGETLRIQKHTSPRAAQAKVMKTLEMVGLPQEIYHRYPHELSGGMKQRVVIAMALIMDPHLIILDEPTSAIDVSTQAQLINLLKHLKRSFNLSFIFITHDIALVSELCDRLAVIYAGEIVEIGDINHVLASPSHPYTEKLLLSVPRIDSMHAPQFIPGVPPNMINPPTGCPFEVRCHRSMEICGQTKPPLFQVNETHFAQCWIYDGDSPIIGDSLN